MVDWGRNRALQTASISTVTVSFETVILVLVGLYVCLFAVLPLGRLLGEAFSASPNGEFLGTLAEQWRNAATRRAFWHTLEVSALSVLVSLAIGVGSALILVLTDVRAKTAASFALMLPLLVPPQITALAWVELLAPSGPLLSLIGMTAEPGVTNPLYSREGIALVMGIEHAPLVFLALRAGLAAVPADLIESARLAGAAPLRALGAIILPLVAPALLAGAALAFVSSIANFGTPAVLGIPGRYPVLTTLIYQRLQGFGPRVLGQTAALSLILALLAIAGLALRAWLASRSAAKVDLGTQRFSGFTLERWRGPASILLWIALAFISILPLLALVGASVSKAVGVPLDWTTATLDHYKLVLWNDAVRRAFLNSFLLASGTALVTVAAAVPLAYLAVVRRNPVARFLDLVADLPYSVPGTVLSIGMILVLLRPLPILGISLYGTLAILFCAYFARFLALGLRPVMAGTELFDRALDEAGQMAGAGVLERLRFIVLPVIVPSAAAGALLVFMAAFNELTVSALLWSSGNETVGVSVFLFHYEGNSPAADALASLSLFMTLGLALSVSILGRYLPEGAVPWRA
ncbi:MAG: iron ABC transporter permease [Pseudaminobacter sp.]